MEEFYKLLDHVMTNGEVREDRTGVGTRSVFGHTLRFDLNKGFPLLTGKRVPFRSVVAELYCFLQGKHNLSDFHAEKCTIWDEFGLAEDAYEEQRVQRDPQSIILEIAAKAKMNFHEAAAMLSKADEDYHAGLSETNSLDLIIKYNVQEFDLENAKIADKGELGPIYGVQWRNWIAAGPFGGLVTVDQLVETIRLLKERPNSRRAVISAWNPSVLPDESKTHQENVRAGKQALPPCHYAMQFWISNPGTENAKLSLMYIMRSNDLFLGAPFNIASYATLTHLMANELGIGVGDLIAVTGDTHIYSNHYDQVNELLARWKDSLPELPRLDLDPKLNISNMTVDAVVASLENYNPLSTISAPVAV